jgi:hypothetical protein
MDSGGTDYGDLVRILNELDEAASESEGLWKFTYIVKDPSRWERAVRELESNYILTRTYGEKKVRNHA